MGTLQDGDGALLERIVTSPCNDEAHKTIAGSASNAIAAMRAAERLGVRNGVVTATAPA